MFAACLLDDLYAINCHYRSDLSGAFKRISEAKLDIDNIGEFPVLFLSFPSAKVRKTTNYCCNI